MKELIKKINALRTSKQFTNGCIYNRAIDEILGIIELHKPEILDKPNLPGWWFALDEDGRIYDCFEVVESEGILQVRDGRRSLYIRFTSRRLYGLRWKKAIMPDWGKDECNKECI